jgi:adenylosuccinate synthase
MSTQKVLIVTDYTGNLHITPVGNKGFYQSRNRLVKGKQFKFREGMTEAEAEEFVKKNKGKDPDHINLSGAEKIIKDKDAEIEELKKQLAEKQKGGSSDAGTSDAGTGEAPKTAKELIDLIKAATTADEVNALVSQTEERKSVLEAAQKQLASFGN